MKRFNLEDGLEYVHRGCSSDSQINREENRSRCNPYRSSQANSDQFKTVTDKTFYLYPL